MKKVDNHAWNLFEARPRRHHSTFWWHSICHNSVTWPQLTTERLGNKIWLCLERKKKGLENKWATSATTEQPTTANLKALNWKTEIKISEVPLQNFCSWHIALPKANTMNKLKIKNSPLKHKVSYFSYMNYVILYFTCLQIKAYFIFKITHT